MRATLDVAATDTEVCVVLQVFLWSWCWQLALLWSWFKIQVFLWSWLLAIGITRVLVQNSGFLVQVSSSTALPGIIVQVCDNQVFSNDIGCVAVSVSSYVSLMARS